MGNDHSQHWRPAVDCRGMLEVKFTNYSRWYQLIMILSQVGQPTQGLRKTFAFSSSYPFQACRYDFPCRKCPKLVRKCYISNESYEIQGSSWISCWVCFLVSNSSPWMIWFIYWNSVLSPFSRNMPLRLPKKLLVMLSKYLEAAESQRQVWEICSLYCWPKIDVLHDRDGPTDWALPSYCTLWCVCCNILDFPCLPTLNWYLFFLLIAFLAAVSLFYFAVETPGSRLCYQSSWGCTGWSWCAAGTSQDAKGCSTIILIIKVYIPSTKPSS